MKTRTSMWTVGVGVVLLATIYAVGQEAAKIAAPQPQVQLGGKDRYSTYVSTDKQIYRPGEKLYVRAAVLRGG